MEFEDLVGIHICKAYLDATRENLIIETPTGRWRFVAAPESCYGSVIEGFDSPEVLIDARLLAVEVLSVKNEHDFYRLKTTKGHCTMEFRHESEWYTGSLEFISVTSLKSRTLANLTLITELDKTWES